jgi:hypothetical protein
MLHDPRLAMDTIAAQAIRNAAAAGIDPQRVALALGIDTSLVPDLLTTSPQAAREPSRDRAAMPG